MKIRAAALSRGDASYVADGVVRTFPPEMVQRYAAGQARALERRRRDELRRRQANASEGIATTDATPRRRRRREAILRRRLVRRRDRRSATAVDAPRYRERRGWFKKTVKGVTKGIGSVVDGVVDVVEDVVSFVEENVEDLLDTVATGIVDAYSAVADGFTDIWDDITDAYNLVAKVRSGEDVLFFFCFCLPACLRANSVLNSSAYEGCSCSLLLAPAFRCLDGERHCLRAGQGRPVFHFQYCDIPRVAGGGGFYGQLRADLGDVRSTLFAHLLCCQHADYCAGEAAGHLPHRGCQHCCIGGFFSRDGDGSDRGVLCHGWNGDLPRHPGDWRAAGVRSVKWTAWWLPAPNVPCARHRAFGLVTSLRSHCLALGAVPPHSRSGVCVCAPLLPCLRYPAVLDQLVQLGGHCQHGQGLEQARGV